MQQPITINQSCKPKFYEKLLQEHKNYFDKLETFNPPWLKEKMFMEKEIESEEDYQERLVEFKKFLAIAKFSQTKIGMTSKKVDALWHQLILFTREYFTFSQEYFGRYFHHSPNLPSNGNGDRSEVEKFIGYYHAFYGKIPEIWNICDCKHIN
jgi:hypothetical protein